MTDFNYLDFTGFLDIQDAISKALCRQNNSVYLRLCVRLISLAVGMNQKEAQIDTVRVFVISCVPILLSIIFFKNILPNLVQYLSRRISIMQLTHYYQNMINGKSEP